MKFIAGSGNLLVFEVLGWKGNMTVVALKVTIELQSLVSAKNAQLREVKYHTKGSIYSNPEGM